KEGSRTYYKSKTDLETGVITFDPWNPMSASSTDALAGKPWLKRDASIVLFHEMRHLHLHNNPVTITAYEKRVTTEGNRLMSEHLVAGVDYTDEYGIMYHFSDSEWMRRFAQGPKGLSENDYRREFYGQRNEKPVLRMAYSGDGDSDDMAYTDITVTSTVTSREAWDPSLQQAAKTYPGYRLNSIYGKNKQYEIYEQKRKVFHELPSRIRSGFTLQEKLFINDYRHWSVRKQAETIAYFRSTKIKPWFDSPGNLDMYFYKATLNVAFSSSLINAEDVKKVVREAGGVEAFAEANGLPVVGRDAESNIRKAAEIRAKALAYTRLIDEEKRGIYSVAIQNALERAVNDQRLSLEARKCAQDALNGVVGVVPLDARRGRSSVYKASNAFFIPSEIPDGNRHAPDGNYHTGLLINLQSSSNPYVMISSPEDVPVAIKRNFLTADRPDGNTYYGSDSAVQGIRDQEGGHLYDCGRILDLAEMADELVTRTDNSFEMGERGENVVPVLALAELHRDVDPLADDGPYSDVDAGFRSEFADVHKKPAAIFYGPYSKNVKEDTYNGNIKYWNTQLTSCNGEGAKQGITRLIEIATDALKALKDNNGQQAKILFNIPYSLERERVNDLLGSHSPQEVEDLLTVPPASPENVLALHYLLSGEAVRSHPFAPIITDFQVDTAISNHLIEAGLDPKGKINAYHPAEWHDDIPEDLKRNSSHWKEDIDAFRAELIAAGYTGLFNDQDFDEVYIRRTITTLGGTSEITKGRVYVYRGLDGKEALYSPSKLLVYIDRKDNKQITKVVQSEDINSFKVIAQKLGINMARKTRGFYNKPDKETWELLLPRKKILTAVEVSKHNFDAVFPFTRSEMANKYFSMDPEPWFRKNQNKKFGTLDPENRPGVNRSFIERVFKSRLQQLPYMEIHADSDDIRQTIRNRLKEFVSGSRKASIGSPFSPRNTDTLYIALSSEESEGYSGLMVNVLRGQVIPIPRDLKQLNDLFRTPEFIQNFQSGVPGSDVESAYLDIKPVDGRPDRLEGNSITHVQDVTRLISVHNLVTSPATVLKAIEYCERTPRRVSDEEILRCRLRPSLVEAMKESVKRYFQLFAMGVIKPTDNQVRYALTLYDRATTLPGRSDDRTLFDTVSTEYNHKDMPLELLEATHYKIASEFDYQTSSKHERELQAQLDVLSTPLRLTGYAMAIGLSVLFPGVAPGIICGVMTTFLTSTTLKIIKTTITDSVEQRNALVSGIIKEMLLAPVQEAGGAGLSKMLGGRFAKLAASLKKAIVGNMGEGALELVSKEAAEKLSVGFVTKTILALEKVPAGVGTWIKQTLVLTVISESVLGIEKAIDNDDITGNPLWQLVREVIVLGLTAGVNEASSILDTPFHRWEAAKTSANQDALITLVRESAEAAGLSKEATDTLVRNMIREGLTIRDLPRETELVNTLREISESMIIVDQVYGQEGRNPNVRRVVPLYEGDSRGLVALTDFNENSKTTIDGEDSAQHANKDLDELERARNEFERAGNELDNESRELERILEEIEGSDGQAEDFSNGGREQGTQQNRVGTIPKTQIPCSSFTNKRGRSKFGRVRNGVFETSKDGNDWKKGGKTSEQLWRKARGKNENVRATGDSSLNAKVVEQHSLEEVKGDLHGQRVEPVIQGDDSLTVKEVERHPIEEVEVDLEEQRAALDSSLFLDDPKNHPQKEEESLQGHPFVGIAGGLLGLGYEAYKHRNPQARPLDSKPDESYGDKQASKVLDHLDEKKREFSVTDQIKKNLKGRAEALDHVAHGDIPILGTVADGAQTVLQVTEFAVSGDVKELDKTKLATAGAKDVYNNVQLGIEGLKKAGKVAHAGVTITEEKMNEMKKAQQDAIELGKDTAVVGLSTGAVIGGGLDALGRIAPHPVAKVGLIGLGAIFKFSGLAHAAEGLENIGGKAADAVSHELATELKSDIQQANKKHREIAFLQLGGFTPKE
ncbi:MAG: hypothetical protein JKY31_06490, partial [Rhodobacteraceae bacterium]|nr:hypothetical protein [Paracoccaceae bacterium]